MAMQRAAELSLAIALLLGASAHAIEINGAGGPIKTAPVIEKINGPVGTPTLNTPLLPANLQTPAAIQTPGVDAVVPTIPEAQAVPTISGPEGIPQMPAAIETNASPEDAPERALPRPLAEITPSVGGFSTHDWQTAPWEHDYDFETAAFDGASLHAAAKSKPAAKAPAKSKKKKSDDDEPAAEEPAKSPTADDGGGPDYPGRIIRFIGEKFRSVYFRPNVPVEQEIVRAIKSARKSIHIALYEFKQTEVLKALREARANGIQVHIVLDYKQVFPEQQASDPDNPAGKKYTPTVSKEIWGLAREGFNVKVLKGLGEFGINHNKIAVIDHGEQYQLGIFGSYNWNWTAEDDHYENANFTSDKKRIGGMKTYWDWLNTQAEPIVYNHKNGTIEMANPNRQWPTTAQVPNITGIPEVKYGDIKLPMSVFSPSRAAGQNIEDRLVQAIEATSRLKEKSERTIDVSIFALRSTKIAEALVAAHKAGVTVRVIMDERQAASEETAKVFGLYAQYLAFHGIEVRTLSGPDPEGGYQLAQKDHHKFTIFGGQLVETGSANYTKYAAIANYENAHFLDDEDDVKSYAFVYEHMWKRAKALPAPATAPALPDDAYLISEIDKPTSPADPNAPATDPNAMKTKARDIKFNGEVLPSFAFRPETPVEPLLIKAINASKKSIRLGLYEFNLEGVLDALRAAKKRGLKIEIVMDRSHVYTTGKDHTGKARKPSPEAMALIDEGFDIKVLKGERNGIQHNKYGVFDAEDMQNGGGLVVFGSYNWAATAENNHFENVVFRNGAELGPNGEPHGKVRIQNYLNYFEYQRGLASDVDRNELESVLTTGRDKQAEAMDGNSALMSEEDEAGILAASDRTDGGSVRKSKMPPPPEDTTTLVDLNGEKFQLEYYSPQGGILDAWLRAIRAAKKSIDIGMFGFYSQEAAEALVSQANAAMAANGGVKVRVVLDAAQSMNAKFDKVPVAQWFLEHGIDVKMLAGPNPGRDPMFEKQHSKFILVDGKFLMTGSFNMSLAAENFNFENENVVVDPTDVAAFVEWFERLYERGWVPRERGGKKKKPSAAA
jgi:phosphatidylserine/phosphatidylglycerophosphate/cardiolipin synthase-like enzyme